MSRRLPVDSTESLTSKASRRVANSASDTAVSIVMSFRRAGLDTGIATGHQCPSTRSTAPTTARTPRIAMHGRGFAAAVRPRIALVGAPPAPTTQGVCRAAGDRAEGHEPPHPLERSPDRGAEGQDIGDGCRRCGPEDARLASPPSHTPLSRRTQASWMWPPGRTGPPRPAVSPEPTLDRRWRSGGCGDLGGDGSADRAVEEGGQGKGARQLCPRSLRLGQGSRGGLVELVGVDAEAAKVRNLAQAAFQLGEAWKAGQSNHVVPQPQSVVLTR